MTRRPVLAGLVVAERGGRVAAGIATHLLATLGATVLRLEDDRGRPPSDPASWHTHPLMLAGKVRVAAGDRADETWQRIAALSHVAVASHPASFPCAAPLRVLLTAFGANSSSRAMSELAVQAESGAMATTGPREGVPCVVRAPLFEALAGLNAATSVLTALRAGTRDVTLDLALLDSALALNGTFHPQALADPARRFRQGAAHSLCAPWNAYPTRDKWIAICVASDDQWLRFAERIGRQDLAADSSLRTSPRRVAQADRIDAAVSAWTRERQAADGVEWLRVANIPASIVRDADPRVASGMHWVEGGEGPEALASAPVILTSTPLAMPDRIAPPGAGGLVETAAPYPRRTGVAPFAGIRVVEVGPYTAGPLAGRLLADLGAEVIKIEPPGGENSRGWSPACGGISGYFANYNCGKRSVVIDLASDDGARRFRQLVSHSDVLLQNLKPDALSRLGLAPERLATEHPALVTCSISGYGRAKPPLPALDTVVQAGSGLMSLVDAPSGDAPIKTGFSFADLTAAHAAAFGIAAALHARDRDGEGQEVEVSMHDALVWLSQLGWTGCVPEYTTAMHGDAYALNVIGEPTVPVREVADAVRCEEARRREVLRCIGCEPGRGWSVLASPLRWQDAPSAVASGVPDLGADDSRFTSLMS